MKFSPQGGNIWLRVLADNDEILVDIEDEGSGIPADVLTSLERKGPVQSRQGTAGETGTGFGLSLAEDLLHDTGAQAQLMKKEMVSLGGLEAPGKGTLVRMRLKTAPPTSSASEMFTTSEKKSRLKGCTSQNENALTRSL